MKYKIGEVVTNDETSLVYGLGSRETLIKKGERGFIDKDGYLVMLEGEAKGKLIPTNIIPKKVATKDIAYMIFHRINQAFKIEDLLNENTISVHLVKKEIENVLDSVF